MYKLSNYVYEIQAMKTLFYSVHIGSILPPILKP